MRFPSRWIEDSRSLYEEARICQTGRDSEFLPAEHMECYVGSLYSDGRSLDAIAIPRVCHMGTPSQAIEVEARAKAEEFMERYGLGLFEISGEDILRRIKSAGSVSPEDLVSWQMQRSKGRPHGLYNWPAFKAAVRELLEMFFIEADEVGRLSVTIAGNIAMSILDSPVSRQVREAARNAMRQK